MSALESMMKEYEAQRQKLWEEFFKTLVKLQNECKHEHIHWMQELAKDGSFKRGLFKRCFVCGATLETLDANPEVIEQLLKVFDDAAEKVKATFVSDLKQGDNHE